MNKKVKYIIIAFLIVFTVSSLITKNFIIGERSQLSIEMLTASLNTLAPDLNIENSKIISGPFLNYQIVGDIYNDDTTFLSKYKLKYWVKNLSSLTLDNSILQTEIFLKYPTKIISTQDFSTLNLTDNFVAYVSLKEFYTLEYFLSKYRSDSIIWYIPDSYSSKIYYENELRSPGYSVLGFNSDIYDSIWQSSIKLQEMNTLKKIDISQNFASNARFLEQNFLETLNFLHANSKSNYFNNYANQLSKDIDYFETTGIEIFGIVIKNDKELVLKLIDDNIVSNIELKK